LYAGEDGTEVLARLIAGVVERLVPGCGVALELAPEQAPRVALWCREAGLEKIRTARDLAGRPRVVSARRPAAVAGTEE
jgi:release factor glutamine methyltransferase